jgi:hypothetical protein
MKSFNQFLKEYYIKEETPVGRVRSPREQAVWDKINARELAAQQRKSARNGSPPRGTKTNVPRSGISGESGGGALARRTSRIPGTPDAKDFEPIDVKVIDPKPPALPSTNARRSSAVERSNQAAVGSGPSGKPPIITPPPKAGTLARRTSRIPGTPDAMVRGAQDAANKPPATPKPPASTPSPTTNPSSSAGKPPALPSTNARRASAEAKKAAAAAGSGPTSTSPIIAQPTGKFPSMTPKRPGLGSRLSSISGPALNVAGAAMDYKDRRDAGQSRARAAGGAASSLAGYAAAARLGAMVPGPPIVKGVAAIGAGMVGADNAQKAYDWAADKTRPQRQAISKATGYDNAQQTSALIKPGFGLSRIQKAQQTANTRDARQVSANMGSYGTRQGSSLTGIGKNTSFDKKAGTITSQGKTAKLASTQLIRDPNSGKQVVGDLAYRGGKATYLARPSIQSRNTSLSANIGRALNIGSFSKSAEQQASKNEYRTALKNTQTYQKQLGIKPSAAKTQKLPGR